jgi:exosortase A-associated hydrolase 2
MSEIGTKTLIETPFFFDHRGGRIFAVLHEPDTDALEPRGRGIVFCAPFAEEAAIAQRVCAEFARVLATRGFHVLRFDYRGCGDSLGDFDQTTLSSCMDDIRAAVEVLRERAGAGGDGCAIGLLGLRLGATLAAMVAANGSAIESLTLWEPIVDLPDYLRKHIRQQTTSVNLLAGRVVATRSALLDQLRGGKSVDLLGYPLSSRCFHEFEATDVMSQLGTDRAPALVMAINRRPRRRPDLESLVSTFARCGRPVTLMEVHETPFWLDLADAWRELDSWQQHDDLFHRSLNWLEHPPPPGDS